MGLQGNMCVYGSGRGYLNGFFSPALLLLKRKARYGVSGRMGGHCEALWGTVKVLRSATGALSLSHFTILPMLFKISNACRVGGEDATTKVITKALIRVKTEETQSIIAKEAERRTKRERLH